MIVTAEYMERAGYFGIWMKGHEGEYAPDADQVEVTDPGEHVHDPESLVASGVFFTDRDRSFRDLQRLLEADPKTAAWN